MRTLVLPAARYMYRYPYGSFINMAIITHAPVAYWAVLLGRQDWLKDLYEGRLGFKAQIRNGFSTEGWSKEGHYHSDSVSHLLFWAEMLVKGGYPKTEIYNKDFKRLFDAYTLKAPFWHCTWEGSELAANRFGDPLYARIADPMVQATLPSTNMPSLGFTVLRRDIGGQLYAIGMNWGTHEMRNAPDRMGVFIRSPFFTVDQATYNDNSVDQATIVVDGHNQTPQRGSLDQFMPNGPAMRIAASDSGLYPGVTVYRTAISLASGAFVVIDRAASAQEHTYDWPAMGLPRPTDLTFTFTPQTNALGTEYGYDGYNETATVDGPWGVRDAKRALLVLAWPKTLVATKKHPESWRGTTTLVRRTGTIVDAGVAYVPTMKSADVRFAWASRTRDKVVATLEADGTSWGIAVDYAAPPGHRCTVTRPAAGTKRPATVSRRRPSESRHRAVSHKR